MCVYTHATWKITLPEIWSNNQIKRKIGRLDHTYELLFILKKAINCLKAEKIELGENVLRKTRVRLCEAKQNKALVLFKGVKALGYKRDHALNVSC